MFHTFSLNVKSHFITISVLEILKNLIFKIPIISKISNISNYGTISTNSINLDTNGKLIKYFLRKVLVKPIFTLIIFGILLFVLRTVLSPTQWGTWSQRVDETYHTFVDVPMVKNYHDLYQLDFTEYTAKRIYTF